MVRFLWLLGLAPVLAYGQQSDGSVARPDLTLHYRCEGQGAPLLILSGGPGLEVAYMEGLVRPLSAHNRCILLEQRGTGRSQPTKVTGSTYAMDSYLDDLEALRKGLGYRQLNILGHSWGGILAMAYTAKYPSHVHSLTLLSSGGMTLDSLASLPKIIDKRLTPEERKEDEYWSDPAVRAKNPELAATKRLEAITPAYFYDTKTGEAFAAQLDKVHVLNPGVGGATIGSLIRNGYDLRVPLTAYHGPCFVTQGAHDVVGADTAEQIHETIYGSQLLVVDKCGHFEWIEQPRVVLPALEAFLAASTPSSDEFYDMDNWFPVPRHFHGHGHGR